LIFDAPFHFCPKTIEFRAYSCNSFLVLSECGGNHNNVFYFKFDKPIEQKLVKEDFFKTPALTLVNKFNLANTEKPNLCFGSTSVSVFDETWIGTSMVEPINFALHFGGQKSISYPIKEFFGSQNGYSQKLVTWTCNQLFETAHIVIEVTPKNPKAVKTSQFKVFTIDLNSGSHPLGRIISINDLKAKPFTIAATTQEMTNELTLIYSDAK